MARICFPAIQLLFCKCRIATKDPARLAQAAARVTAASGVWAPDISQSSEESAELFAARYLGEWAIAALNEVRGSVQERGARPSAEGIDIWLGYHDAELSLECFALGSSLFKTAGKGSLDARKVAELMEEFWKKCRHRHPDFQAKIFIETARKRGLPFMRINPKLKLWQFGWGERSIRLDESNPDDNSAYGVEISRDKVKSKLFFRTLGAPICRHVLISRLLKKSALGSV